MSSNHQEFIALIYQSLVLIHSNEVGNRAIGTGFVIYQDTNGTYLLTCSHVVDDVGGANNVMADGVPATVIASDDKNSFDLAVLRVEELWDKPVLNLSYLSEEKRPFIGAGYGSKANVPTKRSFSGVVNEKEQIRSITLGKDTDAWGLKVDPENYLKEGNSGSPVVDLLSKCVVGVVSAKESNGEKGTAVSLKALKEIWSDMPPDLVSSYANDVSLSDLSLPGLKPQGLEEIIPLSLPVILTALILLGINTVSLIYSYIIVDSAVWRKAYQPYGWVIEMFRTAFILLEFIFLVRPYFSEEIREFFGFKLPKRENKRILLSIRFLTLLMSIGGSIYVWQHHFFVAPEELKDRAECWVREGYFPKLLVPQIDDQEAYFKTYKYPYIWYFPQSIVNYILLMFPAISIIIYSATKDWFLLIKYRDLFIEKNEVLRKLGKDILGSLASKNFYQKVETNFYFFRENFMKAIQRYLIIFLLVSGIFSYELLIGHLTLSFQANVGSIIIMVIVSVALILVFIAYLHYEQVYQEASNTISNISPRENHDLTEYFQSTYNYKTFFFQKLVRQFFSFSVGFALLIFSLIIFLIVRFFIVKDICYGLMVF